MSKFIIEGGVPLHGTHYVPGNKNAALPMLAAALLADEPVKIVNLPNILDVRVMLNLIGTTGAGVCYDQEAHDVVIDGGTIRETDLEQGLCDRIRTSILLAGPLLAKCGHARIYPPGGDVIGQRRLDTHFEGLRAMGATVKFGVPFEFEAPEGGLHGAGPLLLDEASVTATENLVMAAVLADGPTEIFNAACEPHVQDLCRMLVAMGARIVGIGTNRLFIEGVRHLHGATVRVGSDYIEAASYLAAAAATHGSIEIAPADGEDFAVLRRPFKRLGVEWEMDGDTRLVLPSSRTEHLVMERDISGAISKIDDGIWPAVPTDLLSVLIVLATQAEGIITFHEKMFENRLYFVDHLINMGASIVHCDPHRVVVSGPGKLHPWKMPAPDIRAGMALLIAGLCAEGTTVIHNAESIDRGYESVDDRLRALGARIHREA